VVACLLQPIVESCVVNWIVGAGIVIFAVYLPKIQEEVVIKMPDTISRVIEKGGRELMDLEIVRDEKIFISFRLAPEIEQFFKNVSAGEKSTTKWLLADGTPPKYYDWKTGDGIDAIADAFFGSVFNTYGERLFDGERANIAFLRTVHSSKGVVFGFDEMMSKETLEQFAIQVRDFVIRLYKQFIRKVVVKASVQIEELM